MTTGIRKAHTRTNPFTGEIISVKEARIKPGFGAPGIVTSSTLRKAAIEQLDGFGTFNVGPVKFAARVTENAGVPIKGDDRKSIFTTMKLKEKRNNFNEQIESSRKIVNMDLDSHKCGSVTRKENHEKNVVTAYQKDQSVVNIEHLSETQRVACSQRQSVTSAYVLVENFNPKGVLTFGKVDFSALDSSGKPEELSDLINVSKDKLKAMNISLPVPERIEIPKPVDISKVQVSKAAIRSMVKAKEALKSLPSETDFKEMIQAQNGENNNYNAVLCDGKPIAVVRTYDRETFDVQEAVNRNLVSLADFSTLSTIERRING